MVAQAFSMSSPFKTRVLKDCSFWYFRWLIQVLGELMLVLLFFWMGKFSCRERWEEPSVESYGLASEQSNISLYVN